MLSAELRKLHAEASAKLAQVGSEARQAVQRTGAPAPDVQIKFLKGLLENKTEGKRFLRNPKEYVLEHGVLLDPDVVKLVVDAILTQKLPPDVTRFGEDARQAVIDLGGSVRAVPAAVAAGAAVAMAAAAVAEAVVTVVRTKMPQDIARLKGMGPQGIKMPGMLRGGRMRGPR